MAIKVTAKAITVAVVKKEWLDKDSGQRRAREVQEVRWIIPDSGTIGVISMDVEKAVKVKEGQEIVMQVRKLEEKSGFDIVYGDVVSVK